MIIATKLYDCSCSHVSRKDDLRGTVDPLNPILRSIAVLLLTLGAPTLTAGQSSIPPNVLFIAIDDMNDWTSYLQGHPQARTPKLGFRINIIRR